MRNGKGLSIRARRIIAYAVLVVLTVLCLVWFYILLVNASRSNGELTGGFSPLPGSHFLENWLNLSSSTVPIFSGLVNSLLVSGLSAILSTYFSAMTAYALHAYDFKGRKAITTFILAIMTIPMQVTALGFVQLVTSLGLDDSIIPLILVSIAAPAVVFFMKQYMASALPRELIEAARVDGAGELRIFNRIVIPMVKPAIAVQAIFTFVASWNSFFLPALLLHSDGTKTLPVLISQLRSANFLSLDMGQVYMMILFTIAPVIIVYFILSKFIVGNITLGGVKG